MKRLICLLLTIVLLALLPGCGNTQMQPARLDIFAMDTYMSLVAYGDTAEATLAACSQIINELEAHLSRTREDSDVSALNITGTCTPTEYTMALLERAVTLSELTDGLFDVTVEPLVSLWNITGENPYVPTQEEIDALLPLVGSNHIHFDGDTAALDEGCSIDLGGIGKGYASDLVAQIFRDSGIESGTVSLGGNAYVQGTKPDGSLWSVGIQDPADSDECALYIRLQDAFVVTSGAYQRNFTAPDGTFYHHILDPRTGAPALTDLTSVSIIGSNGTTADALSTALFIMGEETSVAFWRNHPELDFDIVLITADDRIVTTLSADIISIPEGSAYEFQTLS